jgi:hypothetical protein
MRHAFHAEQGYGTGAFQHAHRAPAGNGNRFQDVGHSAA